MMRSFLTATVLIWAALTVQAIPAAAAPYAAIVMDMRDGRVYHARNADRRQHPASLTKMMTLYLTFEAIRDGRIGLDTRVRVSRHAARQPASKLYVKAGQRVRIRDMIRAAAIKSANDAAMVLAEAVGGSQREFARMMTERAHALGMKNSTFKNPHGLTTAGHMSTARDMAILARRLYFDFPQYYNIFGRTEAVAAGRRIYITNRLLRSYRGAEGMKTGYTRAAGYNLVSIAARGQERVISVVMGGRSSKTRNAKAAELLDLGFRKAPSRVAVVKPRTRVASATVRFAPVPLQRPFGTTGLASLVATPARAETETWSDHAPLYAQRPAPRPGVGANPDGTIARRGDVPLPLPRPDPRIAGDGSIALR